VSSTLAVASSLVIGFCDSHLRDRGETDHDGQTVRKWLAHEQFEQMSRGQFRIARGVCPDDGPPLGEVGIGDIARWYTILTTEGLNDAHRSEIESANWTYDGRFAVHRAVLLGNKDEVRNVIQILMDHSSISTIDLRHNPEFFLAKQYIDASTE
jgi:hypothetical protein